MTWKQLATTAVALLTVLSGPMSGARAAVRSERASGPTPPRLRFVDGEVSFWRPGAEDWAPAKVNTPLAAGDSLYTGDDANLELQLGPGAFVRAGSQSELGLESLESDLQQLKLTSGHAALDVRRLPRGQAIEIDTPNAAFTIDRPGYYRVDVDQNRTAFSTRRGGEAAVVPSNGEATDVGTDKQVVLEGDETPELTTSAAPEPDEWDRWNLERAERASEPARSARYVSPDVAGADDLDRYGDWRETPRYGHVWVPHDVSPEWVPYSTGRWVWDPYYGWTWVDDAPWGWAPYHYGRWVYVDGFWGWAPGPVVVAPVYAPALVAFFGGPSVSVSVGVPSPFVGWVALGFGEPVIPWWGPVGFVGTCWWGGWGGPHIVNNVVIQHNTFVNVRNVTVFQNAHVHHAVIGVHRDRFGQGHVERVRLAGGDASHLRPIHGHLGVKPTPSSLVASEGHGARPPHAVHTRPVVATRPPQDVSRQLHAAGLQPASGNTPPPRLVQPPRHRGGPHEGPVARQAPPAPAARHGIGEASPHPVPPPRHGRRERPELGSPEPGAPQGPAGGERRPHGTSRAPERSAPPAPPRHMERASPEPAPPRHMKGTSPQASPPRHMEGASPEPAPPRHIKGTTPQASPPRHMERTRPEPPARGVAPERPGRGSPTPQLGGPPTRAPHERGQPQPRRAPHGNPQQMAPAAPPSAHWDVPRVPDARAVTSRSQPVRSRSTRPRRMAGADR
jgi:hypothetical protein